MATPARDPLIAYLRVHATMLRGHQVAPATAALLAEHVNALELLVDVVRDLPEDDERLLMLVTLAVRHGQFTPWPGQRPCHHTVHRRIARGMRRLSNYPGPHCARGCAWASA